MSDGKIIDVIKKDKWDLKWHDHLCNLHKPMCHYEVVNNGSYVQIYTFSTQNHVFNLPKDLIELIYKSMMELEKNE